MLDHFHAHTRENDLFLLSLNWGYLYEALKAAQGYIKWPGVTPCRLLAGIASVLNCPILSYYTVSYTHLDVYKRQGVLPQFGRRRVRRRFDGRGA